MTYEMEYLMHLYSCGATGSEALSPVKPLDWEKVVKLAVEQSITYTVALPVKKYDLGCPPHIRERLTASLRGAALKNAVKTDSVLDVLQKMAQAEIPTLLIKGIDVARCYKNPECRVSADTDLLVKPEDEQRAAALLTSEGFAMEERPATSNHAVGNHPTICVVELHVKLISDEFAAVLLKNWTVDENAFKNCTVQDFGGKTYYALEPTDNLIFLTFHMLKHFLYGGVSLRMMMDNALYAKSNLDKIDCARYEKTLGDTNFLYTMQVIFGIMVKYCGFEKNDFPIVPADNTDDMLAFLNDLEAGGWQGQNEGNKGVFAWFYYRYQTAVNAGDKTEISSIRSSRFSEYKSILFPPFKVMASKYPKLNKKHYLYPYYVLHRIFTRGGDYVSGKSQLPNLVVKDDDKLSDVSKKRLELFKELKIM